VRDAARSAASQTRNLVGWCRPNVEIPGLQRTASRCAAPGTTMPWAKAGWA